MTSFRRKTMNNQARLSSEVYIILAGCWGSRSRGDVHAEEEGRHDNGGHYNNGCEMIV